MHNRVYFFDTTLRDGEQSPGATMNLQEKLRLAHQLEVLGVDIMEAGFPASSPGDFEAVRAIAAQAGDIQVAGLARCVESDIDRCWEAVKSARNPRIHIFLSTSPLHMQHKLRKDPEEVLKMAVAGVRRCAGYTDNVEFSAEDFSRSERDFLCRIVEAAIQRRGHHHQSAGHRGLRPARRICRARGLCDQKHAQQRQGDLQRTLS